MFVTVGLKNRSARTLVFVVSAIIIFLWIKNKIIIFLLYFITY